MCNLPLPKISKSKLAPSTPLGKGMLEQYKNFLKNMKTLALVWETDLNYPYFWIDMNMMFIS